MVFVLKSKQRWLNHNNGGDWFVQVRTAGLLISESVDC